MAPTGVLARQHFKELSSYAEKFGYETVYLGGDLKAKEKKEVLKKIKSGEAAFVVGTHAVISDDVEFKSLALTIVDEEHKFGVIQRESLRKKAGEGVHNISMSATPIPRSLALTLYGDAMDIFTISTMPNGRKPVKTAVVNEDKAVFDFMNHEIKKGHQCYIVCPLIGGDGVIPDEDKGPPESVEEVYQKVCDYFLINNPSVKAAVITGKMKDEEKTRIIGEFSRNETQILIATTIIEVGVNVPNATVITVMNAERFGLAGLHQLRGRVGRSDLQSYCMLKSTELENDRLKVMCRTTNGFEIAEEDLKLRGTGDFLGTRQSGDDENVKLMLKYPQIYEQIKDYIKENEVSKNDSLKL
jgi:ATP-dependent DNA helicase RecG